MLVVELVLDVTDQLLHHVVKEDHPDRRTELIDRHRQVGMLLEEKFQQRIQRHGVRHHLEIALDPHQVGIGIVEQFEQILDVDQSDRLVEVTFYQGEARVLAAYRDIQGLFERLVGIEHDHLGARRHHVAHP